MMVRQLMRTFFLVLSVAWGATAIAASPEERAAIAAQNAEAIVSQYQAVQDVATLAAVDDQIEHIWRDLNQYHGRAHPSARALSLIRARSATARGDKRRTITAWHTAMEMLSVGSIPAELLVLNIEAANACAQAGDTESAARYFAAARAYVFVRGNQADNTMLQLRIDELQQLGGTMPWRELRDALGDLRDFSETFPMWAVPRLEALLSEAEIRMKFQPGDDDKRLALSGLKAQIILMQKGMREAQPPQYVARMRQLFYTLEDQFQL